MAETTKNLADVPSSTECGDAMKQAIVTLILEPNRLVREGLERILAGTQFQVSAHASTLKDLRFSGSDGELMFIIAPSADDADDPIMQVRRDYPSAWIVFLAGSDDMGQCLDAVRAGANAFLTKSLSADALVKSLELVTLGAAVMSTDLVKDLAKSRVNATETALDAARQEIVPVAALPSSSRREVPLSSRELSILRCIKKGESNKHIARQHDIAEATVKVHVKAILRKIGVCNRTQAAIWAMNQGQPKLSEVA